MKPSELKLELKARFHAGIMRPVFIKGSPGVGKSEIVKQITEEERVGYIMNHTPLMQPEDIGFPIPSADKKTINFIVSNDKFPFEGSDCPERGILVFEEMPQATDSIQKIIANAIQEREIHGKKFKKGWMIICTGNRQKDRAGANRILSHLENRWTNIDLEVSFEDWKAWAIANGVSDYIISFLELRKDLLNQFDPNRSQNPTPRSWSQGVARSLGIVAPCREFEMFAGDVGEAAAAEFCHYLKICRELPSLAEIIANPDTAMVPEEPSAKYAVCGALARIATAANFGKAMRYIRRLPAEFSVLFVKDSQRWNRAVTATPEFIQWATNEGSSVLV